jgi:hypothetical protein
MILITLFVGGLSLLMGVILLGGGAYVLLKRQRTPENRSAATGVVVELRKVYSPRYYVWRPVVEFQTQYGQVIQFQATHGTRPSLYSVGQSVKVLYDPRQPEQAEIDSWLTRWFVPGLMLGFGALWLIVGLITFACQIIGLLIVRLE